MTLSEPELLQAGQEYAGRIDAFLIEREQSLLSKLIAIGGASEEESFEIQIKAPIPERDTLVQALNQPEIKIVRKRHYREYDTYFHFSDPETSLLRFREDHFVDEKGKITNVRSRLTLLGTHEHQLEQVVLSRVRYFAPATQSLRFYREYFRPDGEVEVEKDRLRYLVMFRETEFFINIDQVKRPELGCFVEIKTRTWSRKDARRKAELAKELMAYLGANVEQTTLDDYLDMVKWSEILTQAKKGGTAMAAAEPIRVLFAGAEAAPLVKVGGLGDVAGVLPSILPALPETAREGRALDVRVVIPYHPTIPRDTPAIRRLKKFKTRYPGGAIDTQVYQTELNGIVTLPDRRRADSKAGRGV